LSEAKRVALDWVNEKEGLLVDVHQRIWEYAEVGLREFKTGKLLADMLEGEGFRVERGVAGMPSAFVATYGSGGPVIGVMGELDALPGISQKAVPYKEALGPRRRRGGPRLRSQRLRDDRPRGLVGLEGGDG